MPQPVVEVATSIKAGPDAVWQAMTEGAMFPGTSIESDWKIGHPIVFKGEWQGKSFTDRGEIQSLAEAKELSFTHWSQKGDSTARPASYHLVQYQLEPQGQGTHVTLRQFNQGEDTKIDDKTRAEFEKNWTMMLGGLKKTVEKQ